MSLPTSRIGHNDNLSPNLDTLHTLHRAHAMTIPFENLDIILGRGISLELGDIQAKLLRHRRGWPYLAHNLIHDLAALNQHEMILWDTWGLMDRQDALGIDDLYLLDHLAAVVAAPESSLENIRRLYERDGFKVPATITSYTSAVENPPILVELES